MLWGAAFNGSCDPITSNLYGDAEAGSIPEQALLASLGCGNPTALAELHEGEIVLDLGSGAASTCSCPRAEWARPARRTDWT